MTLRPTLRSELQVATKQPHGNFARKWTMEERAAISARQIGKKKSISLQGLANIVAAGKRKKGLRVSAETRAKMSVARSGRSLSAEHRARISEGQKGNKRTEATYAKQRAIANRPERIALTRRIHTGKTLSEATKRKVGLANTGRPKTPETIAKIVAKTKGKHRSSAQRAQMAIAQQKRWQGRERTSETNYYRPGLKEVVDWRNAVYTRDGYVCQHCHAGPRIPLNAHHIKPWAKFPETRFDLDNGITLCIPCHRTEHKRLRTLEKT